MELQKIALILLIIFEFSNSETAQNKVESTKGLGLLLNVGKVYMKKSVINTLVGISFPGKIDLKTYIGELNKTEVEVNKIIAIPGLATDTFGKPLGDKFKVIGDDLDDIEKILYDVSQYHDTSASDPKEYLCKLEMSEVTLEFITEITRGINSFMKPIDYTVTEAKLISNPEMYEKIYSTVLLIHEFVQEKKNHIKERLEVMNALANDFVPPQLPYLLDTLKCLQSGELEHVEIRYCDKSKTGLFCEVSVNVHKKLTEYEKFTPIVYEDVQIRGHEIGQIFVQDENKHWALIDCDETIDTEYDTNEDLDEFGECDVIPYQNECTAVVLSTEYDKILKYCNFTMRGDVVPIRRSKTGILLHGEDFLVKEVDPKDSSVINILQNKYPVHIVTNNNLAVTLKDREILLKPYYTSTERTVQYTYLPQSFIESMKSSAKQSDLLTDIEFTHIVDLIYGLLFLLVIPVLLTLCCCSAKNSEVIVTWKENRKYEKAKQKSKSESNLEENSKFMREMRPLKR
jgi:hypothetical protein